MPKVDGLSITQRRRIKQRMKSTQSYYEWTAESCMAVVPIYLYGIKIIDILIVFTVLMKFPLFAWEQQTAIRIFKRSSRKVQFHSQSCQKANLCIKTQLSIILANHGFKSKDELQCPFHPLHLASIKLPFTTAFRPTGRALDTRKHVRSNSKRKLVQKKLEAGYPRSGKRAVKKA